MYQQNQQQQQEDTGRSPSPRRGRLTIIWLIIAGAVAFFLWMRLGDGTGNLTEIPYSTFRAQVSDGNVSEITIADQEIRGELRQSQETTVGNETVQYSEFITYVPSVGDEGLLERLDEQSVTVNTEPVSDGTYLALLINLLPFLLLLGIGYIFLRRMRSQGQSVFSMGQSRARRQDDPTVSTTFADVAGLNGAKTELREIIEYLRDPSAVQQLGGKAPRGVLLVGPPGTGKTLLARAVAGEAGVPFFNITGSDFMEMFVGVGASRVREMFKEARTASPCIIFIDELDSIGRRRGAGLGGGHDEREQTLNQLLSELDGFDPSENVVVMAATNRPDILDPALLRPGRFDRRITVDLPTTSARQDILKIHARNKPLAEDVDLERMAQGTTGFSGADLENMLNEAALLAARKRKKAIEWSDVEEARDKILMGLAREGLMLTDEERELIAYHEAGHAVVAALLPNADPIHKVTIIPRGRAMGVTQQVPERDKYIYPREYLLDRMAVMMGGRAAEESVLGTATSGAENDLKQATQLARKMVLDWGMSERWGQMAFGGDKQQVFLGGELTQRRNYSDATAREVDQEVQSILRTAYDRALDLLQEHRSGLDRVADALLDDEEIPGKRVLELVDAQPAIAD